MIGLIIDSYFQWNVQGIVFSDPFADCIDIACSWEEFLPVLMERDSHHSISHIEGLLYTVSMMDIYIKVQDTLVILQQL